MYIILTSKPGQYRSLADNDTVVVEAYDYLFYGRLKAVYEVARLHDGTAVRITETDPPYVSNDIPLKFLDKFDTLEAARAELEQLIRYGNLDARLQRRDTADTAEQPAMVEITFISNNDKQVRVPKNSNLLRVSIKEQGGIPFKCGGGLCGTCKCLIEEGREHTDDIKPKERRHLTPSDFEAGYRMACQTFVNGNIKVSWQPRDKQGNHHRG